MAKDAQSWDFCSKGRKKEAADLGSAQIQEFVMFAFWHRPNMVNTKVFFLFPALSNGRISPSFSQTLINLIQPGGKYARFLAAESNDHKALGGQGVCMTISII